MFSPQSSRQGKAHVTALKLINRVFSLVGAPRKVMGFVPFSPGPAGMASYKETGSESLITANAFGLLFRYLPASYQQQTGEWSRCRSKTKFPRKPHSRAVISLEGGMKWGKSSGIDPCTAKATGRGVPVRGVDSHSLPPTAIHLYESCRVLCHHPKETVSS
ncbi:hypothetical protein EV356DRAFT_6826 [Viridothelium virens]|uniref:Uncharacterized protein n=1 Tax=Viridothelium virens TaxID=1048519 RepID=A0A6A6HRB7_VIRVR|nr:hypothetical protein EV356DRAFT_6826 [Viridothelium virens]